MRGRAYHHLVMVVVLAMVWSQPAMGRIFINEVVPRTLVTDVFDTPLEWIELFNDGDENFDLEGHFLTDDMHTPRRWRFPSAVVPAKGFLVVYATGGDVVSQGGIHTSFRLKDGAERLALYSPHGELVDSVSIPRLPGDNSYGRIVDGGQRWVLFQRPTRQVPNGGPCMALDLPTPSWSSPAGVFREQQELTIVAPDTALVARYSKDGSIPSVDSPVVPSPLVLRETTCIKARFFDERGVGGPVATTTHLKADGDYRLPVLSLSAPPASFFDIHTGFI